jgi:hypothetical protein
MAELPVPPRRLLAAAIPGTLLLGSLMAQPAGADTGSAADPPCAWGGRASIDDRNALFPESHAAYWAFAFTVSSDLRISLAGRFPDSRFASLTVYKGEGGVVQVDGVDPTLTDYEIVPDAGTLNPWQHGRHHPSLTPGSFTIDVVSDPGLDAVNTLPLAAAGTPDGTQGLLVYRIYLPTGGDFDDVPLPEVTLHRDEGSTTLPGCSGEGASAAGVKAGSQEVRWSGTSTDIRFALPASEVGILPNTDSGYVAATVTPPGADKILVIRGRGATSADGEHPSPWPQHETDLRYWSLCTNLDNVQRSLVANPMPDGSTDYGCRNDDETTLDASGYYTYVVGTEAQRAAIEQIPEVTFVPWSAARPTAQHVIFLRNMLAGSRFEQAIQNITEHEDPAAAQAVMGDYYPRDAICPLETLQTAGASACVDGS